MLRIFKAFYSQKQMLAFVFARTKPLLPKFCFARGAGGIRTLVQTGEYQAFYRFSRYLVFVRELAIDYRLPGLSFLFRLGARCSRAYSELVSAFGGLTVRKGLPEDISSPRLAEWIKQINLVDYAARA